jgi:hypothetical protein
VTAGIVLATRNMPAERGCPAALDGTHHLHLLEADVTAVSITPRAAMIAEDVRDLQARSRHGRRLRRWFTVRLAVAALGFLRGLIGLLARHRQPIERALDRRD